MPIFNVQVDFTMSKEIQIEADSEDHAEALALEFANDIESDKDATPQGSAEIRIWNENGDLIKEE